MFKLAIIFITMQNSTHFFYISILFFIALNYYGCREVHDRIPEVFVDIELNLNNPDFYPLQTTGNHVRITGGVSGIIVYRKSSSEFLAVERACPHDPEKGVIVTDETGHFAIDSIGCGSEFSLLIDGMVTKGPSKFPLKIYHTAYLPNLNILQITN